MVTIKRPVVGFKLLDVANLLSLSRIALAGLVWMRPQDAMFLFTVVAVAAVTDGLDGLVGRRTHAGRTGTANVGAWLDPLCDKIFVCSAAAAVVVTYDLPLWILALIVVRDVAIALLVVGFRVFAGANRFHAHDFRARAFGKATMAAQLVTLAAVVVAPGAVVLLACATALLGVAAVVERAKLAFKDVTSHDPRGHSDRSDDGARSG